MNEQSLAEQKSRIGLPTWLFIAIVPNILFQILRLQQTTALGWILCDYAGRLGTLLVLAVIPLTRRIAFRKESIRISIIETAVWMILLIALYPSISYWCNTVINAYIPGTRLQTYFPPRGWLRLFDFTAGLALVAYHEEVFFRRCLWEVVSRYSNGFLGIFVCAIGFALFHWTTSVGNMAAVFFFGFYAVLFFRRCGALWPMIVCHFLIDFGIFTGLT